MKLLIHATKLLIQLMLKQPESIGSDMELVENPGFDKPKERKRRGRKKKEEVFVIPHIYIYIIYCSQF